MSEVYLRFLMRAQLGLALRVLAVLAVSVGLLPLIFWVWPGLAGIRLGAVSLGWLLPGVLVYPVLIGLGRAFTRRAEANEAVYAELLDPAFGIRADWPDSPEDGR